MRFGVRGNYLVLVLSCIGLCFLLSSCAGKPKKVPVPPGPPVVRRDITHTVAPGETLWRISKMYDVMPGMILKMNSINDATSLRMGQVLLIPSAAPIRPIVSLPKSDKWRYIIIHHSATEEGSSLEFHKMHLAKGWDKGVGYHFVIDKASSGKQDGAIEQTPRWIKQEDGAHCKAADMNIKAIGICLVGNFSQEDVSKKQMASLVFLVNKLRKQYKIPIKNIIAHGHVIGAATDCPGKEFPWERFIRELQK